MAISTVFRLKFDGASVKKGLAGVNGQFKSLGAAAMKVGKFGAGLAVGAVGVTAALAAAAIKLNKIGEEANTVDNRLANVTKQMGLFGSESKRVSDRLSDLADTQGRLLGIDDDVISNTEAKLMTFKELAASADIVGGAFDRATMAAIDMAAAGFGTAEMNAVQLGKALNDPIKGITALNRSGINFTAAEKEKIKVMVESGKILNAQNMVLSAIEKQVGNTAAATADGSERMKVSFSQLVEAFAKPFSEGFNEIPGAMEGIFPKLKALATSAGVLVSNAISDAVNGNFDRFVAIGDVIGTGLGVGIKSSLKTLIYSDLFKLLEDYNPLRQIGSKEWREGGKISESRLGSFSDNLDATARGSGLSQKVAALRQNTMGLVPNTQGQFRYAQQGERSMFSDANGNKVIRILTQIQRDLSPQP